MGLALDGEFIITMRFTANDAGRAVQVIDSRFGAHKVSEVAMHEDGKALCDQAQKWYTLSTPRNWVRVSYKWDTDKVGVTAWHEKRAERDGGLHSVQSCGQSAEGAR